MDTFQHYANMFEYALRVAKEAEESDRMALDAQKARLAKEKEGGAAPPNKSPSSVPPGEPLYEELPAVPPVISPPTDPGIPLQLPSSLIEKGEDSMKLEDTSKTVSDTSSSDGSTTATGTTVTGNLKEIFIVNLGYYIFQFKVVLMVLRLLVLLPFHLLSRVKPLDLSHLLLPKPVKSERRSLNIRYFIGLIC